MSASRPDLHAPIHKALRALMADLVVSAGRMDPADDTDLRVTLDRIKDGLALCELHLRLEEEFVHPMLEARRPGTSARASREHAGQADELRALGDAMAALAAARPESRAPLASGLYRALARWMADNFLHMEHEEAHHNPALWEGYDDARLHALHESILAAVPPATKAAILRWMLPSSSHAERLAQLAGLRASAPREAYEGALALARQALGARDWQKLFAALEARPTFVA